ncbi:MAG: hypothetical protein IJ927_05740 [Eubacterium sp.]|jgi:hypothetical protein|nr:hypothetical protein [Eubacterium sp.]
MNIQFKKLKKNQIIIIAVIAVLLIILVPSAIYCGVHGESPKAMISDMFTSNEEQLIGNWQGDKDLTAYSFKEDGTFESYISSFSYTASYVADSSKLTLTNPASGGNVVYKYSIHGDTLTLKLIEESGKEVEEKEVYEYKRVDTIRSQSFVDFLKDYAAAHEDGETTENNE